jgi:hypothetical protein
MSKSRGGSLFCHLLLVRLDISSFNEFNIIKLNFLFPRQFLKRRYIS